MMKDIKSVIKESLGADWRLISDIKWAPNSSFMFLYPGDNSYGFYSESDIENFEEEFGLDPQDIQEILKLKPGQCYTNDGENIYIRIKK